MLRINKTYTVIISISLGLLFMISGIGKMQDASSFEFLIKDYGLGKFSIFAPLIIIVEILLGLNLILLINLRITSFALLLTLSTFTLAYTYAFLFKGIKDCGCFGTLNTSMIPAYLIFGRNIFLIFLAYLLLINHNNISNIHIKWKSYIIYLILLISSFIVGNTSSRFSIKTNIKQIADPRNLIGKRINKTPLKSLSLNTKSQLIFILSPSCSHCINSIENIKKIFEKHIVDTCVVYLSSKANFDRLNYTDCNLSFQLGDTNIIRNISTIFPTTLFIKDDTIKTALIGEVPSYINLKKLIY